FDRNANYSEVGKYANMAKIVAVEAGIKNINLDLIYGIENQTLKDLENDLKIYTSLPIKHISAYMLTPYENTPLGKLVENNKYNLPDEKLATDMFFLINEYLENNGFKRYELSNWAKNGYECKHNLLYWTDKQFLGIGVSAWSYVGNKRFGNTKNIYTYIDKVEKGIKPISFEETLDKNDKRIENIMLGLRLRQGIYLSFLKDKKDTLQELVKNNFANIENGKFYLTEKGLMVINKIVEMLL
ncbi:MAG: coproporphyrinogen III oxidase family protein, partial [Aquificota bacterium]